MAADREYYFVVNALYRDGSTKALGFSMPKDLDGTQRPELVARSAMEAAFAPLVTKYGHPDNPIVSYTVARGVSV